MAIELQLNGGKITVDVPPEMPLLWVLRDVLALTGTKYGCGIGACGACTVLIDGQPRRSCMTAVSSATGAITTIEGLAGDPGVLSAVQQAWLDASVPQCGWCQPAQILCATALLAEHPRPDDDTIAAAMDPILCRCGTQQRIGAAIRRCSGR